MTRQKKKDHFFKMYEYNSAHPHAARDTHFHTNENLFFLIVWRRTGSVFDFFFSTTLTQPFLQPFLEQCQDTMSFPSL